MVRERGERRRGRTREPGEGSGYNGCWGRWGGGGEAFMVTLFSLRNARIYMLDKLKRENNVAV